jgi:hypothetical protein
VCVVQSVVFRVMCCGWLFIFYHLFCDCIVCLCFCYCIFSFSEREQVTLMSVLKKTQSRLIPKPSIVLILKWYAHSGEAAYFYFNLWFDSNGIKRLIYSNGIEYTPLNHREGDTRISCIISPPRRGHQRKF